jgi:hypothetical protein
MPFIVYMPKKIDISRTDEGQIFEGLVHEDDSWFDHHRFVRRYVEAAGDIVSGVPRVVSSHD